MFLLKAHKPEVYNPVARQELELAGKGGGAVQVQIIGIDPDGNDGD